MTSRGGRSWIPTPGWAASTGTSTADPAPVDPVAEPADPEPVAEEAQVDGGPENRSVEAQVMSEDFVDDRLRAPATAAFPGPWDVMVDRVNLDREVYVVRSHVDAENGFGAQIRTLYVAKLRHVGDGNWRLLELTFDGQDAL